jgi:hypothetical protein
MRFRESIIAHTMLSQSVIAYSSTCDDNVALIVSDLIAEVSLCRELILASDLSESNSRQFRSPLKVRPCFRSA